MASEQAEEQGWFSVAEDASDGICGFTTDYPDKSMFPVNICCQRNSWRGTERCIWHAKTDGKSVEQLKAARADGPERLDGAYLVGVEFGDAISFRRSILRGADLSDADFSGADFVQTDLTGADIVKARLRQADCAGAILWNASLTEAKLVGVDFSNALLEGANLSEADLPMADLSSVYLPRADFTAANLVGADLSDSNLNEGDLTDANLNHTDLTGVKMMDTVLAGATLNEAVLDDVDLRDAYLAGASLEDATLVRADLRRATLWAARLYQAQLTDVRINQETEFGLDPEHGPASVYEVLDDLEDWDVAPMQAAAWMYRRLEALHEEHALNRGARDAHIAKEEAHRKHAWNEHQEHAWHDAEYWDWLTYEVNRRLSNHGESPRQVIKVSLYTIVGFGLLYPFIGGMAAANDATRPYDFGFMPDVVFSAPGWVETVLANQYFSAVTFTTLGYGDIQPATPVAQLLASVESFVGALLMALFVYVLGRRTEW